MEHATPRPEVTPVKLFWWNRKANFGDDLSRDVVSHVSGRDVVWAKPVRAQLFAIGSIMKIASRGSLGRRSDIKPAVWGSGCMSPMEAGFLKAVQAPKIVRGPITAALLGLEDVEFGDPGLLARQVYGMSVKQNDTIGIIPHHSEVDDIAIKTLVASDPSFLLIDPRRPAKSVCADIASCAQVFSSSLHGLIVADSFGVSNHWFVLNQIHQSPSLKFYDYATGIERALPRPLALEDVAEKAKYEPPASLYYQDGIIKSQEKLLESFPEITYEMEHENAGNQEPARTA